MRRKYRVDAAVFGPIRALQTALHIGRRRGGPAVLAITLSEGAELPVDR